MSITPVLGEVNLRSALAFKDEKHAHGIADL
jgi:hypothetical protein